MVPRFPVPRFQPSLVNDCVARLLTVNTLAVSTDLLADLHWQSVYNTPAAVLTDYSSNYERCDKTH